TLGNPLYHWTALELKRYFGISELLSSETADSVWTRCNESLRSKKFSARGLLDQANVECICTSDPLHSDLGAHSLLKDSDFKTRVLPSLRIDDFSKLGNLDTQLDHFSNIGCKLADHSVVDFSPPELRSLAVEYARRDWVLQLHIGAQRETSTRLRQLAGPAGGYASIGSACDIAGLCRLLDEIESSGQLPRIILYPLNPADYAALATLTGSFSEDGVRGKIQLGPAWWYNDHALGIRAHLDALASYGLLSTFIGMTTDSRSLLSMVRHEYFRRVFCDWLGQQVETGVFPNENSLLALLIRHVCYQNAHDWLNNKL
ncbi:MAG: glucuronate isomerase, partial [Gloeobacteraceae cyanobacterium ES-bin-144]|nr:glucuronate isomerase [Verrucomicrobiales bacterium]